MKKIISILLSSLLISFFVLSLGAAAVDWGVQLEVGNDRNSQGGGGSGTIREQGGSSLGGSSIPGGKAITLEEILELLETAVDVFYYVSGLAVVGVIVYSGIKYALSQGVPAKVTEAQNMLKAGIIGAFIILGIGVILNTVSAVLTRGFFTY